MSIMGPDYLNLILNPICILYIIVNVVFITKYTNHWKGDEGRNKRSGTVFINFIFDLRVSG